MTLPHSVVGWSAVCDCDIYTHFFLIFSYLYLHFQSKPRGAQWLSGRVLDSRPKGRGFEPHRRHCVVVIEQDTFILA